VFFDIYLEISVVSFKATMICLEWAFGPNVVFCHWKHHINRNRVFLSWQQWAGRTEAGGDGEDVEGGPAGESQTGGESSEYH